MIRFSAEVNGVLVDPNVEVGVTVRTGRAGTANQPDPSSASLTFVSAGKPLRWLKGGQSVRVFVRPWEGSADPDPLVVWTGRLGDLTHTLRYRSDAQGNPVTIHTAKTVAAGIRAFAARKMIGDEPWETELDGTRIARILFLAGSPAGTLVQLAPDPDLALRVDHPGSRWSAAASEPGVTIDDGTPGKVIYTMPLKTLTWDQAVTSWADTAGSWEQQGAYGYLDAREPVALLGTEATVTAVIDSPTPGYVELISDQRPKFRRRLPVPAGRSAVSTGPIPVDGNTIPRLRLKLEQSCAVEWFGLNGGGVDAGTMRLIPRDIDRQTVTSCLDLAALSGGGVVWETRDGAMAYADADQRALSAGPFVRIPASAIRLDGGTLREAASERVNKVTITYGTGESEQPSVTVEAPWSIEADGEAALRLTTDIADVRDADTRGKRILRNRVTLAPTIDNLPILLTQLHPGIAQSLILAPPGALIEITGLDPDVWGSETWAGYVEGSTLDTGPARPGDPSRPLLTVQVSDRVASVDLLAWDDLPELGNWDELRPVSWDDATGLKPMFNDKETP